MLSLSGSVRSLTRLSESRHCSGHSHHSRRLPAAPCRSPMAQRQRRAPLAPARASAGSSSSGSSGQPGEEDSDASLNAEFQRASDPQRLQRMASHLELAWTISKSRSPEQCDSCRGAREKECEWCHGTGVLMVGDMLFCSLATHDNKCPICKGTGQCKCEHCRGTGFRATWLGGVLPIVPRR